MKKSKDNIIKFLLLFIILLSKIVCEEECDIGPNGKCKTCGNGKNCASCNFGYYLDNGHCEFISSFIAVYETTKENQGVGFLEILKKDIVK